MQDVASNGHAVSNGAGPSSFVSNGLNGRSLDQAIDLTQIRLPSPPPLETKKPICIGAVQSRAIMLYPSHAAMAGAQPLPGSREKFMTLMYHGAELLRVKLKVRRGDESMMRPR
jgi:SWI/SNF-related matrix-associated actin-dependent regulator of chromatin subfamily A3